MVDVFEWSGDGICGVCRKTQDEAGTYTFFAGIGQVAVVGECQLTGKVESDADTWLWPFLCAGGSGALGLVEAVEDLVAGRRGYPRSGIRDAYFDHVILCGHGDCELAPRRGIFQRIGDEVE